MAITFQPVTDIALANEYLAAKLLWRKFLHSDTPDWKLDTAYEMPITTESLALYQFAIQLED